MRTAPAFTLTEVLVVLIILGLIVSIVAMRAPDLFDRARLRDASARLQSDLDMLAINARVQGAFGTLDLSSDGSGYRLRVGENLVLQRKLPANIRISGPSPLAIDPAGRLSAARLRLTSPHDEMEFTIDPVTGRANPGNGAHGSRRRRRNPGRRVASLSRHALRHPIRHCAGTRRSTGDEPRTNCLGRSARNLARHIHIWLARGLWLDAGLRNFQRRAKPAPDARDLHDEHQTAFRTKNLIDHKLGGTPLLLPALTLLEMSVALGVLSLLAAFAFSNIGPWVGQGQQAQQEAIYWREAAVAQLTLSELGAGIVDPQRLVINPNEAHFRTNAPRLSPTPLDASLRIEQDRGFSRLVLSAPQLAHESVLLDHAPPLRFRAEATSVIVLEVERNRQWLPLLFARVETTAQLTCAFDRISRSCR